MSDKLPPTLFQLPYFRCLVMGRASVAAFALLAGYVNSLKPIKLSRAGNADAALSSVAKSAFRRTGRFMIPAVISTICSWLVCQFGGYKVAHVADSAWIRDTSPTPSASFATAFYDLFQNLSTTWLNGYNAYDRIQWTLTFLLKGSMLTYLTLFATIYVKPRWRMLICLGMYWFEWRAGDALIGFNVYCGIILAELTLDSDVQNFASAHNYARKLFSAGLIILGLFFMSYPEENPSWARWSHNLELLGSYIFPQNAEYARFYPGLGVNLLTLGVMFNNTAKKILSTSFFCWMGKLSFPIYLLHAPLIRTVLAWVLFGASIRPDQGKDENGNQLPPGWLPIANRWVVVIALPLFYVFLYRVANLWAQYVDPFCGRVTNLFEELVFRDDAKASSEKPLLLS
ncbi:hypothetical protein ACLMJK_004406 [Lecanora helva]